MMTLMGSDVIGYLFTAAMAISFAGFVISAFLSKRDILAALDKSIGPRALIALFATIAFFVIFSLLFVHPAEQLYFDENIYQGIAINVLQHGNAEWCNYGTGYLHTCLSSVIYHDPVGWTFFMAIAFAVFGIGTTTAYGLQLLVGAVSIALVFLFSLILLRSRAAAVLAAAFAATSPPLFVWSRTEAVVNLPFMAFTLLSFFMFYAFVKTGTRRSFAAFLMSLVMALYMRVEAALLVPIFAFLYLFAAGSGISDSILSIPKRVRSIMSSKTALLLLVAFALLTLPELSFLMQQSQTGNYGQTSSGLFSLSAFKSNIVPNVTFFLGMLNQISSYPAVFPLETTVIAILGAIVLAVDTRVKDRYAILLALGLWVMTFHLFYDFFYAGSVLYGVDSRFMLEILPPLFVLAGFGVYSLSEAPFRILAAFKAAMHPKRRKRSRQHSTNPLAYALAFALSAVLIAYPFIALMPNFTLEPGHMPQQSVVLRMVNFIYGNYTSVPSNCLVFSFTPDVWYELNRSAAQIGYFNTQGPSFVKFEKQFSCFVFDHGYWCNTEPFSTKTCGYYDSTYNTTTLASSLNSSGFGPAIYQLLNYTPGKVVT